MSYQPYADDQPRIAPPAQEEQESGKGKRLFAWARAHPKMALALIVVAVIGVAVLTSGSNSTTAVPKSGAAIRPVQTNLISQGNAQALAPGVFGRVSTFKISTTTLMITVRLSGLPRGLYQVELATTSVDPASLSTYDASTASIVGFVVDGSGSVAVDNTAVSSASEIIIA